jgi:hypothetical protein
MKFLHLAILQGNVSEVQTSLFSCEKVYVGATAEMYRRSRPQQHTIKEA